MHKHLILFCLVISPLCIYSQHLGAYSDYHGHFFIFDHGKSIKVEDIQVQSFSIGGECVMYINSQGNLKIYHDGNVTKLEPCGIKKYIATDHLAAYQIFDQLYVVINDKSVVLSRNCPLYQIQDSLIVFYDKDYLLLKIFYKGNDIQLDEYLPKSFQTGDGFVAYVDYTDAFKVFYDGQIVTISNYAPESYFTSDNLLVFTDYNSLQVFYSGKVQVLEGYIPQNFRFDWNTLAYLDNSNRIWVFSDGEKKYLTNDLIESFEVHRDLILIKAKMNRNLIYYQNQFYDGIVY